MIRAKARSAWLLGCSLLIGLGGSCSESDETEPFIPPRVGAEQPSSGGDPVSEGETCERLREAEEAARVDLQCDDLERPECPAYVRPAGTGCWEYSEDTVAACVEKIAAYDDCSDFELSPCILTAVASDAECPMPGGGGAGGSDSAGEGGSGATPGAGGAPEQGGAPGAGGIPDAPGGSENAGAGAGGSP
jgi:hypothetical protein